MSSQVARTPLPHTAPHPATQILMNYSSLTSELWLINSEPDRCLCPISFTLEDGCTSYPHSIKVNPQPTHCLPTQINCTYMTAVCQQESLLCTLHLQLNVIKVSYSYAIGSVCRSRGNLRARIQMVIFVCVVTCIFTPN